ncbi:uncharacterized protein ACA1_381640 [Acanthamoeba castellanii str. Neff]|uniref:Uncharacterized protein n=1 Tax=Acanthamoeba castellanii (strain ATCC 30010 / Neff) TaxID=1257118 RepID=L8GQN6_ACACF|nr:uncharacterized protein ACA1_381640 [Acanthamoeba castellanii str. Neff]ELR14446.1 hypothetical protein ACA1_381640 [Acanthamoeba castellanii str. Neff]
MHRPSLPFFVVAVVILGLAASPARAQDCANPLADNLDRTSSATITRPLLAQRFQVVNQSVITGFYAPLSGPRGVDSARLYADSAGAPSATAVPNATLDVTSEIVGFTATPTATADGLVLGPGLYWLVVDAGSTAHWERLAVDSSPAGSSRVVLLGLAYRANPNQAWVVDAGNSFKLTVSGCAPDQSNTSTPSPSPSPSPSPGINPPGLQVVNVTSSFEADAASFNLTATIRGNDTTSGSEEEAVLTLRAELEGIQVGDITVPASSLTGFQRTQLNESSGDPDARTTFAYVANADATAIEQEFSFHRRPERGNFFGRSFGIAPHSFKWSLRLSSINSSHSSSSSAVEHTTVFDVVLLADADYSLSLAPIEHSLSYRSASGPDGVDVAEFVLELRFPPFNGSLAYDPSLGIDVLLGSDDGDGGDGGSSGGSDMALVIGVAVALPIAAVLVVLAISAGVAIGWWLRKRETTKSVARGDSVNFHYLDSSEL